MKKLIVFISVILFLSSCDQTHYYNIPEDMKPQLVNNDTICFWDSANNRIDTFSIKINQYFAVSDGRAYAENINIDYYRLNNQVTFKSFSIDQGSLGVGFSVHGNFSGDIWSFRTIWVEEANDDIIKNNLSIHGVIYPTVYLLQEKYSFPDTIPNTVYYTLQHGIIRYDYSNGRKYEIINN